MRIKIGVTCLIVVLSVYNSLIRMCPVSVPGKHCGCQGFSTFFLSPYRHLNNKGTPFLLCCNVLVIIDLIYRIRSERESLIQGIPRICELQGKMPSKCNGHRGCRIRIMTSNHANQYEVLMAQSSLVSWLLYRALVRFDRHISVVVLKHLRA